MSDIAKIRAVVAAYVKENGISNKDMFVIMDFLEWAEYHQPSVQRLHH